MNTSAFKRTIWDYYKKHGRHSLPWRKTKDPYKILVSELMLQQTQVSRVIEKYNSFLKRFPTLQSLANTPLSNVLQEWQGLGYNRRAKYLHLCTQKIVRDYNGKFPKDFKTLCSLPGIGPATAGDLLAFSWNIPVPVIETNIRNIFIHFFFPTSLKLRGTSPQKPHLIHDKELLPLIEKTLDKTNPREWLWALFDYGAYLKTKEKLNSKSAHYVKQSTFKGSNREKRSHILKLILQKPHSEIELIKKLGYEKSIVQTNLTQMTKEGLIIKRNRKFEIV